MLTTTITPVRPKSLPSILPSILPDTFTAALSLTSSPLVVHLPRSSSPATTMIDQQKLNTLLRNIQTGKYRLPRYGLPQGMTPGTNPEAEKAYLLAKAVRDVAGGTPVPQAIMQIPEHQQAVIEREVPVDTLLQASKLIAGYERRELSQNALFSSLRRLMKLSSPAMGEDMIRLVSEAKPAAGSVTSTAIHSDKNVGIGGFDSTSGESTLLHGYTGQRSAQRLMGTHGGEADMTRINLIVGAARNVLDSVESFVSKRWKYRGNPKDLRGLSFAQITAHQAAHPSQWTYSAETGVPPSIDTLLAAGTFGFQGGKERAAGRELATDRPDPLNPFEEKDSGGRNAGKGWNSDEPFGYEGKDNERLRQGIEAMLGSDLIQKDPKIRKLLEGAYSHQTMRKTLEHYANRTGNTGLLQGDQERVIANLVNSRKDTVLREDLLAKAARIVSSGGFSPSMLETIRESAAKVGYTKLVELIDTYSDPNFFHSDERGVALSASDMAYIERQHPREAKLLSSLIGGGSSSPNLSDPRVRERVAQLPYAMGAILRTIKTADQAQRMGVPLAQSQFSPFVTEMSALAYKLENGGVLDPMALHTSVQAAMLGVSPDVSHARLPDIAGVRLSNKGRLQTQSIPHFSQSRLFEGMLSPQELAPYFENEGAGVGLEGYERRLEDLLRQHAKGQASLPYGQAVPAGVDPLAAHEVKLLPEQVEHYQAELAQVQRLRGTLHDPAFQLQAGHYLNIVHRAATGKPAIDQSIPKESDEPHPYQRFMAPFNNQFREGARTLGSIEEVVDALQGGISRLQGYGTIESGEIDRVLSSLGQEPSQFWQGPMRALTPGKPYHVARLARQFPGEEKDLLAQFTRAPFQEGQTVAFMGGMPGFTDETRGTRGVGLEPGTVGTLAPIQAGVPFGLTQTYGMFKRYATFTQEEYNRHGVRERKENDPFFNKPAEPMAMLHTRDGRQVPVRLSQVSDLQAKGLFSTSQTKLDRTRLRHDLYTSGSIEQRQSRRQGTDADMADRLAAWRTTPQGKRYLRAQRRENLPALPPQRPSQNQLQHWAASGLTQKGGANATDIPDSVAKAIEQIPESQEFLPAGTLGGSLGAASPFRQMSSSFGRQVPPALPPGQRTPPPLRAKVPQTPRGSLPPVNPQQVGGGGGGGGGKGDLFWQGIHARAQGLTPGWRARRGQGQGGGSPPPQGPVIAPDTRGAPPLPAPTPADQLARLRTWLTSGSPNGTIKPPSDEQLAFMQDPARKVGLEGGPGTGKTSTAVRRLMHGVAQGDVLPKNVLGLSALKSAASRIRGEYGQYQQYLPQGKAYQFMVPRTFASVAASTVLHAVNDPSTGKDFYPMLQKLGYGHLTGEILADPTAGELYGKDPQVAMKMLSTSRKAFIADQVNSYLTSRGKQPYNEFQMGTITSYIDDIKKGRGAPQSTYTHELAQGQQAVALGQMSNPAALALYEGAKNQRGLMDWDDLMSIAVEAYQKFGPDALPDIFKGVEAVLADEAQDVTPLAGTFQEEFYKALGPDTRVIASMDIPQSLTQGMGGIDLPEIRPTYRRILGMAKGQQFHQLSKNFRSPQNIVDTHNNLLQSSKLADMPHSSPQTSHSGKPGTPMQFNLTQFQPEQYRTMFRSMLSRTGVSAQQFKENYTKGLHPLTGASISPSQIAMIVPRNQDAKVFEKVGRGDIQKMLGVGPEEAGKVFHQIMRQNVPSPDLSTDDEEYKQAQMQMPLLKFMGSRGDEYAHTYMDASLTGQWAHLNDIPGHLRNLNVGMTRAKETLTVGASRFPFSRTKGKQYLDNALDLEDVATVANLTKRPGKNEFETSQGQPVPRFFAELLRGQIGAGHISQIAQGRSASTPLPPPPPTDQINIAAKQATINLPSGGSVTVNRGSTPPPSPPPPPGGTTTAAPMTTGALNALLGTGGGQGGSGSTGTGGSAAGGRGSSSRRYQGSTPGPTSGSGGGGGGGGGSYTNAYSSFGRSMARLGYELQFMGQYFGQIVTGALQQGSEYRQATVPLPMSGEGAMAGTSGFYDFGNLGGGISAYQRNTLPMYSTTQVAQGIRSLYATTGYRGSTPPLGATTDLMGLAAITGMDPSGLMGSMAYLSGSSGQGQQLGTYGKLGGMLTNLFGNVLSQENVEPTLQAASQIVPTLQGLSPTAGSQTGQAMAFFQLAQNAGMTPQNFGDVSSLLGSLSGVGSSPNLQQQYTLNRLGFPLTADTALTQYQQEQTSRNMQMAQYGLMQNINEPMAGIFGGKSTGAPLSLPQLQIRIDQAQIQMDQANLVMSGLQLQQAQTSLQGSELQYQYGKASYGFNLAQQNALYGPIGADYSKLAGYSFQQNQLVAQRSYTSPEVGVMFSPQNVSGLRNQEFYAGLQNQQQSLILGRSPLLADAMFQQQMKYIAQQADFYKRETALRNQQREFDMVWQKRLLDQQGAQVAAQAKIVGYQGYIYGLQQQQFKLEQQKSIYDQKQTEIQQQYLGQQASDLAAINLAMQQFLQGQGPVGGQNLQPEDLVQKMADELKSGALNPQSLHGVIQGLGISPQEQGILYQLVTQLAKQPETLQQMTKNMGNANDKQLVGLFNKLKQSGAFNIQIQQAGQQNASLQLGGTGTIWQQLTKNTQQIADAETTIAKVLAPGTPFLQDISAIANILGPLAVGLGTLSNAIGLFITLRGLSGGGAGLGGLLGGGGGGGGILSGLGGSGLAGLVGAILPTVIIALAGAGFLYGTYKVAQYVENRTPQQRDSQQNSVVDWINSQWWLQWLKPSDAYNKYRQSQNPKKPGEVPGPVTGLHTVTPAQQLQIFQKYANNSDTPSQAEMNQHLKGMEMTMQRTQTSSDKTSSNTGIANQLAQVVANRNLAQDTLRTQQAQAQLHLQQSVADRNKTQDDLRTRQAQNFLANQQAQLKLEQQQLSQMISAAGGAHKDAGAIIKSQNDMPKNTAEAFLAALGMNGSQHITSQPGNQGGTPVGHPGFTTPHVNAEFHQKMNYGVHQGVDFAAAQGTPIGAFNLGRVTRTGFFPWGGEVDVDIGNGLTERYLHLSQIGVQRGQMLLPRQRMGLTGGGTPASGFGYWSSGAHSHVQIDTGTYGSGLDPWPIWAAMGPRDISAFYGAGWGTAKGPGGGSMGGSGGNTTVPKYHDGGIAMRRQFAELGDGNEPEAVVPLSRLQQVLKSVGQPLQGMQVTSPSSSHASVSVQKLADKFEVHVHTTQSKLDDQATDDLADQVLAILNDALAKLTPSGRSL